MVRARASEDRCALCDQLQGLYAGRAAGGIPVRGYTSTYQAMRRGYSGNLVPLARGTLIPAGNPYLPIAFAYRQGIPNP